MLSAAILGNLVLRRNCYEHEIIQSQELCGLNEWNVEYDVGRSFIDGDVPFLKKISKYMLFSFTRKEGTL